MNSRFKKYQALSTKDTEKGTVIDIELKPNEHKPLIGERIIIDDVYLYGVKGVMDGNSFARINIHENEKVIVLATLIEDNSQVHVQHDAKVKEFVPFDETKFYKPEVEEFHQGFEYYMLGGYGHLSNKNVWIHQVSYYGEFMDETESHLDTHIEAGNILVKKLDADDIRSLGFKCEVLDVGQDTDHNTLNISTPQGSIGELYLDLEVQKYNVELFRRFFNIKNKNEFIRILKQAGITWK